MVAITWLRLRVGIGACAAGAADGTCAPAPPPPRHPCASSFPLPCVVRSWGLILYRTWLPASELDSDAPLDLGEPPHDYATVLLEGATVGVLHELPERRHRA